MGRKRQPDLFGGGPWAEPVKSARGGPPDPHPALVLSLLREGPKHRDYLRAKVPDPEAVVEELRAAGHVVKGVLLYGRTDWVYALSENGRLCGVEGQKGEDPDTAGGPPG